MGGYRGRKEGGNIQKENYVNIVTRLDRKHCIGIVLNENDPVKMRAFALILVRILAANLERMNTVCYCP